MQNQEVDPPRATTNRTTGGVFSLRAPQSYSETYTPKTSTYQRLRSAFDSKYRIGTRTTKSPLTLTRLETSSEKDTNI